MSRFRPLLAAACAATGLTLSLTGCGASSQDSPGTQSESSNQTTALQLGLEAAVAGLLAESGIPGAVFSVTEHGDPQWNYVYNSDLREAEGAEPVSLDEVFAYRSISKSFTVTALLQLVDEGAIALEDPISNYVAGVPNGDEITLRNLAEMRSGLANYSAMPELSELLMNDPGAAVTDTELIASALEAPVEFEPDAQYMYSNTNTVLLGMVIAQVTGHTWDEAVRARVTAPLGLRSVSYPADLQIPSPAAVPYQWADGELEQLPVFSPTLFGAAGGLYGTVTDLAAWADELGAGSLLYPATQKDRLASFGSTADDPRSPEYDGYGLGIGMLGDFVGHTGNGLGFQALAMHNPETGVSVAILLNSTTEDGDLPAHLFQQLMPVLDEAA